MNNFGEKVAFLWSVADLLRDPFKRSKYLDVMLRLTVLRRLGKKRWQGEETVAWQGEEESKGARN